MSDEKALIRELLETARAEKRTSLTALEASRICDAYGIPVPSEGFATTAKEAARVAKKVGFPVALKIVSQDILHKTEAGGVIVGLSTAAEVEKAYAGIIKSAKTYKKNARILGVQVQQMIAKGESQEVIIGAVTDPSFGKVVAFGLGGVFVEVLNDVTFRLAPTTRQEASSMLDGIAASQILRGARGARGVDRKSLSALIVKVSQIVTDFPEISEIDLNPVVAGPDGVKAVDVRIVVDFAPARPRYRPGQQEILGAMNRIMMPDSVAVIGASSEEGKIGYSVMKNLVDGGYKGAIYPVNPRADEILGKQCYKSVKDIPGDVDIAVFAIPAKFVAQALTEVGEKQIPGAILIPSGFAEIGETELQEEIVTIARKHNVRLMGPNIYGFYSTHKDLCATFCTPYNVKGHVALSSQSGGVGMAIVGFSRSTGMGVSAIVGLGNKADIDEDDLLTFFEQDPNTQVVAMHAEDLKDGRAFAEVASRVSKKKPVIMLKAGRTAMGARAASSHTGALAGNDKIYDDVLRQCGVIRAYTMRDMLEFARCLPMLPAPKGENVIIITGAGGSGVLLSDACVNNGLQLMEMPRDLDEAFKELIPPFGASGNPVDITGGEPPGTYRNAIKIGLGDERIHALILGYWHTIVTPPMVFAELLAEVVEEGRQNGINKPVVASLVGDVEVEQACDFLFDRGIVAYPYTTEIPVDVLGAKYRWARNAGLL